MKRCIAAALLTAFLVPVITAHTVVPASNDTRIVGRAVVGGSLAVTSTFPQAQGSGLVHFFASDSVDGTTTVLVNGVSVTLPMTSARPFAKAPLLMGKARATYRIGSDPSVIGSTVHVIAVVVIDGRPHVTSLASSGPIIGDDIS